MLEKLLIVQGGYFFLTGLWPILHMRSFLAVTGPKTDLWLVKTVGILIAVIGATLFLAGSQGYITVELFILALGAAAALAVIDVVYVAKGRKNIFARCRARSGADHGVVDFSLWLATCNNPRRR